MPLVYVQITGQFLDSQGSPLSGTATFTPNVTVRAAGIPVLQPDVPVQASIVAGTLKNLSGGTLQLLATDQSGLTFEGQTGFVFYTVSMVLAGQELDPWSFFLPSSPSTVDLWSLANTPAGGGGVSSVTAADASIVIGGTATAPTVRTGTLDVIAAQHPAAADWSNNGHKITSVANGSAAQDAVAFGQLGSAAFQASSAFDAAGAAATALSSAQAYAVAKAGDTMTGKLAPKVTVLTDAASVAVNAALGNDFRLTFTSGVGSSRAIAAPSNPVDGQSVTFELIQGASGGPYTVTWASGAAGYDFGTTGAPTLSTGANAIDLLAFRYSASKGQWLALGSALGF